MSWYNENYENYEENKQREAEERVRLPGRFWMEADSEGKEIIFVDDRAFAFWEHVVYKDGNFSGEREYFTCCRETDPNGCPLCDAGNRRYYVTMYTIIDTTEWFDKKGNIRKNTRRLLALKGDSANIMRNIKKTRNSLVGYKCLFMRTGKQSVATGNHVNFIAEVDLNDEEFLYTSPRDGKIYKPSAYEYEKLFKPLTRKEILRKLKARNDVDDVPYNQGEEEKSPDTGDDEVPF